MKKGAEWLCLCSQNSVPVLVSVQVVQRYGMCLLKSTFGLKRVNLEIYLMFHLLFWGGRGGKKMFK